MKVSKIVTWWVAVGALAFLAVAPLLAQRGKWWQDEQFRRNIRLFAPPPRGNGTLDPARPPAGVGGCAARDLREHGRRVPGVPAGAPGSGEGGGGGEE